MSSILKILEDIVRKRMTAVEGTVHSFEHVERVFKTATYLAKEEKADIELVQVGSLLHDIGWVIGKPHHKNGAKLANEILKEINYPEDRREKAIKIVLHHDLDFRDKLKTLEERIVWDADKIDILGILGMVRTFHWLGNSPFTSVVKGAFTKLKAIYPLLNTKTAKTLAKKRHKETTDLLNMLRKELSLEDLKLSNASKLCARFPFFCDVHSREAKTPSHFFSFATIRGAIDCYFLFIKQKRGY